MAYISLTMKTLIIHPKDITTNFLKPIYAPIKDKTVITGGVSRSELRELIKSHHRVVMLGHGTPMGLLSVGQFEGRFFVIDDSFSDLLSEIEDNIYIWCHASEFMTNNHLNGFGSGMFISELEEANYYDFGDVDWDIIDESNNRFSSIVGKYINEPIEILYGNLISNYGSLASENPIARFNLERLYYNTVMSFVEI